MLDENGQEIPFIKVKKLGSGDYGDVFLFQTQGIKVELDSNEKDFSYVAGK